ncbi:BTB domain-containing protein [Oryctes borbonicus]|uniref:BTB domain-containing protein n=1 Tax=Oryctes borbonicus TaxID=1629725 RepID=A0A0T6AWI8_9SCAR|nr:BTB domain-containing protein [Oryctes borbonicus]
MLIQFMYRGEIIVREDEVQGVLKLSSELQIKGLSEAKFNSMFPQSINIPVKEKERMLEDNVPINDKKSSQKELNLDGDVKEVLTGSKPLPVKMSVPTNAFRLYMKVMQKKLSAIYPSESPADISARIVVLWTNMSYDEKIHFYKNAKWEVGESEASQTWSSSKDSGANVNVSSKRKRDIGVVRIIPQANVSTANNSSTIEIDDDIELIEDDSDPRIHKGRIHESS